MKWFLNVRMRSKIIALVVVLLGVAVWIGTFALTRLEAVKADATSLATNWLPKTKYLGDLKGHASDLRRRVLQHAISTTEAEFKEYEEKIQSDRSEFEADYERLGSMLVTDEGKQQYATIGQDWKDFAAVVDEATSLARQMRNDEAISLLRGRGSEIGDRLAASVDQIIAIIDRQATGVVSETEATATAATRSIIVTIAVSSILSLLLGLLLAKTIADPVQKLVRVANKAAQGDLSEELQAHSTDEIGILTRAFAAMLGSLRSLIGEVTASAQAVAATSEELSASAEESAKAVQQISDTVQQVAAGTQDQSSRTSDVATSVGQVDQAIIQVAKGAESQVKSVHEASTVVSDMKKSLSETMQALETVGESSQRSAESAARGGESVRNVIASMERIASTTRTVAERIGELDKHSQEIGRILEVIDDIAEQTNLLALNAAIEAARAGEHGRGFAVVADEVRKLAERSSSETKAIAELVGRVRQATEKAVSAIDSGLKEVEAGSALSEEAGKALAQISSNAEEGGSLIARLIESARALAEASSRVEKAIDDIVSVAEENTAATEEMAASAEEVKKAVDAIASVSEETAASVEEVSASAEQVSASIQEMAASAQSLADMAQKLRDAVSRFKV
ncbi:MAG TPA: methyl-accepting chemotaxis protein [Firmicutes bacterium]|nr:methyl-accepting chemotaxis protein [Bacillota bacterium]